jgi:hypothetical protein
LLSTPGITPLFTERPAFASSTTAPAKLVATRWGNFDVSPAAGAVIIPRNYGEGSLFAAVNVRISKTISLKEIRQMFKDAKPAAGFGKAKDEGPYKLTFSITAQNLFNRVNNDLPVGNLSSPFFGQSTATLGGYGEGNRSSAGNLTAQIKAEF